MGRSAESEFDPDFPTLLASGELSLPIKGRDYAATSSRRTSRA